MSGGELLDVDRNAVRGAAASLPTLPALAARQFKPVAAFHARCGAAYIAGLNAGSKGASAPRMTLADIVQPMCSNPMALMDRAVKRHCAVVRPPHLG